ncbi:pseudouridine synthase [Gordoniibacillus kamchatkensis]|uniref:Pseudouridine synthase n=1 Tax=Gordoniibacillus kamchatkensis TaxID=1590651 RepID=A0ABR5AGX6_9BACL|nr:RluA family pseudouridine synthase [Paenibacillus sp. VKM B-2647]KIL40306.1 pseudouridine synthase [Paenibacillus sp. VKM B-2647]
MTAAYKRYGEWMELRLPRHISTDEPPGENVAAQLGIPPKLWARLQREGGVETDGRRLRLRLFPRQSPGFEPEWHNIDILFEDDFCLVAAKPAGMPVHPAERGRGGTLANAVAWHYEASGQETAVRHIHRLDADTTGPVLYAKNELALAVLDEAMRRKHIGRTYVAFVHGSIEQERIRIDAPIGRDRHHAGKRRVSPGGDPAVTLVETLERFGDASLVRLTLETGRTHQIRVHMSHTGHPLLGDALYGGSTSRIGRQALHGEALAWPHPFGGETVRVEAPWPDDLLRLAGRLRRTAK